MRTGLFRRLVAALGLTTAAVAGLVMFGPPDSVAAAGTSVSITGPPGCLASGGGTSYCFSPEAPMVTAGTAVTWTNNSAAPQHTVTRCDTSACNGQGPGTGSDTLASGQFGSSFSHTFSGTGTYFYYCDIHGYSAMHGEVIVSGSGTTTTTTTTTKTTTTTTTTQTTPTTATPSTPQSTSSSTTTTSSSSISTPLTATTTSSSSSEVAVAPSTTETTSSSTSGIGAIASTNAGGGGHTGLIVGLIAAALIAGGLGTLVALNRDRIPFLRPR